MRGVFIFVTFLSVARAEFSPHVPWREDRNEPVKYSTIIEAGDLERYQSTAVCGGETPKPMPRGYDFHHHSPADYSSCVVWRSMCVEAFKAYRDRPTEALGEFIVDVLMCYEY